MGAIQAPVRGAEGPMAGVFLPPQPSLVESFAASELARYLKAATSWQCTVREGAQGGPEAVRFWVGTAEPERLRRAGFPLTRAGKPMEGLVADGVYISADGPDVLLVGKAPRGPLNAVYTFLETRIGIHWPEPGEEFIPAAVMPTFDGFERVSNPAFPYRGVAIHARCGDAFFAKLIDWLAKNRLNGFQVFCAHYDQLRPKALPEILKRGLYPNIGGHSRGFFFPAGRYYRDHPGYFALVGGQRQEHTQLCYSNLASVPEYAANVVAYVRERPEIGMVGLWPEDGYGFCECDLCKARSPTDVILSYVNELASAIHRELPELRCEFLSYIHYTVPPLTVKPLPGVVPTYCEYWSRNQFHPITADLSGNRTCRSQLDAWIAAAEEVTLFSYYGDDCIKRFLYNPVMDVIVADFRHYQAAGLKGHFLLLTNPESWWSNAPHLYAYAKAVWDPRVTVSQVERDYYESLYQAAARAMLAHARACRALFDLKTAQGPTGEEVLFGFHFPAFEVGRDAETRQQVAAAMAGIQEALQRAREAGPRPAVLARIAKLESDAEFVRGVIMAAYEARCAAATGSQEHRDRAIDLVERTLALDVIANDDAGGYRSANNSLCRMATAAAGLDGGAIEVPGGFGFGVVARPGRSWSREGAGTLRELPDRLKGTVLAYTYGLGGRSPRLVELTGPRGSVVSVAAERPPEGDAGWLAKAGLTGTGEVVTVATPAGDLALPVYRRDLTTDGKVALGPGLAAGAPAEAVWLAFVTPPQEYVAIPPTPVGASHVGLLKSGDWLQIRFPVPAVRPAEFVCRLGNVVAYNGRGKSYRLVVRADSATGPLAFEGPTITKDEDWNKANATPIALTGVLTDTHVRQGYIDLYLSGIVEGDGWTLYRHDPATGRRIVAVEYPATP